MKTGVRAKEPLSGFSQAVNACRAARQWLEALQGGGAAVAGNVAGPAQAFLVAWLARETGRPICVVCPDARRQDEFFHDITFWEPRALLIPAGELSVKNIGEPDSDLAAARLAALRELDKNLPPVAVVTSEGLTCPAPSRGGLDAGIRRLARGDALVPEEFAADLEKAGFVRLASAAERGQFAVRGGILDVFPWQTELPVRLEFFGDTLDSLRFYDPDSQRSVETLEECEFCLVSESGDGNSSVRDYFGKDAVFVFVGDAPSAEPVQIHSGPVLAGDGAFDIAAHEHPGGDFAAGDIVLLDHRRRDLFRRIREWIDDDWAVLIVCASEAEEARLRELAGGELPPETPMRIGSLLRGFTMPDARMAVLTDAEIFGRASGLRMRRGGWGRARAAAARQSLRFDDFTEGDLVVHLDLGIARYQGLQTLEGSENGREVLVLEFARGSKFYAPLDQGWKISRYVGIGRRNPALSELGDGRWQRARARTEKSVLSYAAKLLRLQAERESQPGFAFPPDNAWQGEFEGSFAFKETRDQIRAIAETKRDMESVRPMDRLICGDVGFGKTEVAIRAAFKAVMGGRQVAFLAPTTVLAHQHWQTLRERMSDYPVSIDLLSRFRTPAQQRETLAGLRAGTVDIVVGTHRLLGHDVAFKRLGLVIVDEEQRFGVLHKDRFKEAFRGVDVLTLSATPIPRTLYLSLLGARDMSVIETPPPSRIPVETVVCAYDERVIRDAIRREMARGGQIFFLHNRVKSIGAVEKRLRELVPAARVVVGHGQMPEGELEEVMETFVRGEADILLCTTIIESGLDIPNANTIIIDRADRFGLADLYQLRGRVGRSNRRAWACLLLPRELLGTGDARKRLAAIRQYSGLGAGFRVAMRDLEIRGAGNILGVEQSGHILAVGFELYCRLLKSAVTQIKEGRPSDLPETQVHLDFVATDPAIAADGLLPAWIPSDYISDSRERIAAHRRLAEATDIRDLDSVKSDWRDRHGRLPPAARHLLKLTAVRLRAARAGIDLVETDGDILRLRRNGDFVMIGHRHPRLDSRDPVLKLRQILTLLQQL